MAYKAKDDLAGRVFGKLTVQRRVGANKHGQSLWLCRCWGWGVDSLQVFSAGPSAKKCFTHDRNHTPGKWRFTVKKRGDPCRPPGPRKQ